MIFFYSSLNAQTKRLSIILLTKLMFAPTSASVGWYHYMTDSLHSKYKPGITDHSVTMERSIPLNLDLTCMEVSQSSSIQMFTPVILFLVSFLENYLLEFLFPKLLSLKSISQNISSTAVYLNTNFPLQFYLLFTELAPNG